MAVRLPVILSQPARRDASTTDLVENIVAAALMIPGLDANLIGDIGTIEPGSTDHICLLGHTRDLVLSSFHELSEARSAWQRLEQGGQFVDLGQDEADIRASLRRAAEGRKVFYYQLAIGQPVDRLLDQCRKLISAQQLSLVSIQWGSGASGATNGLRSGLQISSSQTHATPPHALPSASLPTASVPTGSVSGVSSPVVPSPTAGPASLAQANGRRRPELQLDQASRGHLARAAQSELEEPEEWSALDKLVDDLDAMDL